MEGKSSLGYQTMSPHLILSKIPLKELILSFFPKSHGYSMIQAGLFLMMQYTLHCTLV